MNLSPRWVQMLASAGIDSEHWSVIGRVDATDSEILGYAASHRAILLTHDFDFGACRIPARSIAKICAENLDPKVIGPATIQTLRQLAPELEAGALVSIHPLSANPNPGTTSSSVH